MIRKDFKPFNSDSEDSLNEAALAFTDEEQPVQHASALTVVAPQPQHSTIKEMSEEDRPREKLLAKGADALTVPELLAILIGGGTTEKTAVELTQEIMHDCGGKLMHLSKMTIDELMSYKGIGEARALSIIAAAEIGRRRAEENISDLDRFETGADVLRFMKPKVIDLDHEESWVMLLNNNARLLRFVHLSSGGITETNVDVRMLFKQAVLANATSFILIHNHPSGRLAPSRADIELTDRVRKAGQTMNIRMIDHVIVTDSDYYSFVENGRL